MPCAMAKNYKLFTILTISTIIWAIALRSGLSKFYGRQPLKNFKWYGHSKFFKGCLPQDLLSPLLNTLSQMTLYFTTGFLLLLNQVDDKTIKMSEQRFMQDQ